jgi:ATP-dependent Zn protease
MSLIIELKQLLTKEHLVDAFTLVQIPSKNFYDQVSCEITEETRPILDQVLRERQRKIMYNAQYHDLSNEIEEKLSNEEVILYKTIRDAISNYQDQTRSLKYVSGFSL